MHFYKALIKIRKPGDTVATHEILKAGLSTPEIHILRSVFGTDCVTNIRPDGERPVRQPAELERLRSLYIGRDEHGEPVDVIKQVFGIGAVLPLQLEEIENPELTDEAEEEPASTTLTLPKKKVA